MARTANRIRLKGERRPKRSRRKWGKIIRRTFLSLFVLMVAGLGILALYGWSAIHPVSTLMVYRYATGKAVMREWVPLEQVAPVLADTVLMSEDGQFCNHRGVDWNEFEKVMDDFKAGEPSRGASTITMQTVKNLFLWQSRSYLRKMLELPMAIVIDRVWSKRRIMEIYLNIAEWGPGVFGIEAASQFHFDKPSSDLSAREAALLATTLPNPNRRNPLNPSASQVEVAAVVARRTRGAGGYNYCLR